MGSGRRALLAAALLAAACADEEDLQPPLPEAVEPASGFRTQDVPISIHGRNFHVRASQSLDGAAEDRVSARFRAWLGDVELREVTWLDAGTLRAVVPANALAEGEHALAVEGPYGTRGTLAAAYRAGVVPHLTLDPMAIPSVVTLGESTRVLVRVTNHGPGSIDPFQLQVKRAVPDGPAIGEPLLGTVVGGGELPDRLAEGATVEVEYAVTTTAVGTFECEAKTGGYSPLYEANVPAKKVRVRYDVVPPPVQ